MSESKIWTDANGKKHYIPNMETTYIINAMGHLIKYKNVDCESMYDFIEELAERKVMDKKELARFAGAKIDPEPGSTNVINIHDPLEIAYDQGYDLGYDEGFEVGRMSAIQDIRKFLGFLEEAEEVEYIDLDQQA